MRRDPYFHFNKSCRNNNNVHKDQRWLVNISIPNIHTSLDIHLRCMTLDPFICFVTPLYYKIFVKFIIKQYKIIYVDITN